MYVQYTLTTNHLNHRFSRCNGLCLMFGNKWRTYTVACAAQAPDLADATVYVLCLETNGGHMYTVACAAQAPDLADATVYVVLLKP